MVLELSVYSTSSIGMLQDISLIVNRSAVLSMHGEICEFPSKTLYASKLKSHESVASHLLRDLPNTQEFVTKENEDIVKEVLGTPVVFFDTAGCEYYERLDGDGDEGSRCNENEATVVKTWTERLASKNPCPYSIARLNALLG